MTQQETLASLIGKEGKRDTGHRIGRQYQSGKCPICDEATVHEHTEMVLAPKPVDELIEIAEGRWVNMHPTRSVDTSRSHVASMCVWRRSSMDSLTPFARAWANPLLAARIACAIKGMERLK